MYIEYKGDHLEGPGRIGRVSSWATGKTLYYQGKAFQSREGGYKANYFDIETNEEYWISGCKKRGDDTLYPGIIEIEDDVREEYWTVILGQPDRADESKVRSEGKYLR